MEFIKNVCIACLAELIKLLCPWYLGHLIYKTFLRIGLLMITALGAICIVFPPRFVDNAIYQVSRPLEFFQSEFQAKNPPVEPQSEKLPAMSETERKGSKAEFEKNFPISKDLKFHVEFWKNIFSRYTSKQAVIYDEWHVQVVYAVVNVKSSPGLRATKQKYKNILLALDRKEKNGKLNSLTPEEAKVYKMFEHISEKNKFQKAVYQRMRVQYGQKNHFIKAIQRSGLYQQHFEAIFKKYDMPLELTRIPFVESYFKYSAYSYVGAAGLWQFIPSTARLYDLRMNSKIDERYDPFKAADSAARLLKANYDMFKSWPLAVSAYHHGTLGIQRAVKQLKTTDLGKIVKNYRGARYGFYSRNYYPQFIAVAQVMQNPEKYWGPEIKRLPPICYEQVIVKKPVYFNDLAVLLGLSQDTLITLNRELKRKVIQSKSPLPKNYVLKVPPGKRQ